MSDFAARGWARLGPVPGLRDWVAAVRPLAVRLAEAHRAEWLRCGGTWFAGVNLLPNDAAGAVPGGPPLPGALSAAVRALTGLSGWDWEPAQVSVVHPGYPRPSEGESEAAFRFRRDRDAAHVDGLLPVGPTRRRHLREHHGFILGIPLTATGPGASPLVVWEGSHLLLGAAFARALAGREPTDWAGIDLTDAYHAARRAAFATWPRVALPAVPGEATLLHRHMLHGVAPWEAGAEAPAEGRMIAYFRPDPAPGGSPGWWLSG